MCQAQAFFRDEMQSAFSEENKCSVLVHSFFFPQHLGNCLKLRKLSYI